MTRVLVLYAHPAPHRSLANAALIDAVRDLPGVTVHDLYETYPDLLIDIEAEQDLLVRHDAIVFQHPLFWYSAPAIVKEWLDVVLEHGFAYGQGGVALAGKAWLQSVTSGGVAAAYGPAGRNRFTVPELLRPFEATAALCGFRWLDPFVVHAAHLLDADGLAAECARYRARIDTLTKAPVAAAT
ncbi:MAG: NAD(P)H-dependent oxidoreductase [Alphaproteobacteria bacterium]|nr:NAD(P)H-dependent oxidoreductase [Alphaproteobacteria bacterium]